MTALIVIGCIVLFFAVLFSLNLKLEIRMLDTLVVRGGLGPLMLTLSPKKKKTVDPRDFTYKKHQKRLEKERKQAIRKAERRWKKDEAKAAKKAEAERIKADAENALEDVDKKKFPLGFILALIKFVFRELRVFIGYFRTEIKVLHVTVGGEDAAEVGKTYGYLSQSVAYLLEILKCNTRMKKLKAESVSVNADFLLPKTTYRIHIKLRLSLWSIFKVGCHALGWFIGQKLREEKRRASSDGGKEPVSRPEDETKTESPE